LVVAKKPGELPPLQFVKQTLKGKYNFKLWGTWYSKLVRVGNKRLASQYEIQGFVTHLQKPTLQPKDFGSSGSTGLIRMLQYRTKGVGREVTTAELTRLFAAAAKKPNAPAGFIRVSYGHLRSSVPGFMSFKFKITPKKTPPSITSSR
jgi:hypothetical protein